MKFYVWGIMRKQKRLMMLCSGCTAEEAEHVLAALDPIKWIRNEVTPTHVWDEPPYSLPKTLTLSGSL